MDEMTYKYGDDKITIWENSYGTIHIYEENESMEVEFYSTEAYKALEVLENIYKFLLTHPTYRYIDTGCYECEDEDGYFTGEWCWADSRMEDEDINPYFSPSDSFSGNCLYKDELHYIIESIQKYLNPKDISNIDNFTLKSVLKLKRNLINEKQSI